MSIRNETVSMTIGGTLVYPTSISITLGVGKGYNSCTIRGTSMTGFTVGDEVVVTINGMTYSFIVDEKSYSRDEGIQISCKGKPCKLEDSSSSDEGHTYVDSDELISVSVGAIPVVNNIPNISFSESTYNKATTPMARILDMVRTVGGEAFEVDGTLYLEPLKVISASPTITHAFLDSEVFDYAYSDKRDKSIKTKQILFNPLSDDIYSKPSAVFDYDVNLARGEILFNPSLSSGLDYSVTGLTTRVPSNSLVEEQVLVTNEIMLTTLGGIDRIVDIKLNGEPFIDYTIYAGYNVVKFNTLQTGEFNISYNTRSVIAYALNTTNFIIQYQCIQVSDTIDLSSLGDSNIVNSGSCYSELSRDLSYEFGGTLRLTGGVDATIIFVEEKGASNINTYTTLNLVGGGVLTIKYIYTTDDWLDKSFMSNLSSVSKTVIEVATGTVFNDESLNKDIVYLDKPITGINDIYFGSQVLSGYTYNDTGDIPYIEFQSGDFGKSVEISMNVELVEITIPPPTVGHPVIFVDVISCGGVATSKFELSDEVLCSLPATFDIDVASIFNVEITDIFGATLTGDFGDLTVTNKGTVTVSVSTQGIFTIYCDLIKDNGVISVDSRGVE